MPAIVRRRPRSERAHDDDDDDDAAASYVLSGVGWGISSSAARAPPLSYDARVLHGQVLLEQGSLDHDQVIPYSSRYTQIIILL